MTLLPVTNELLDDVVVDVWQFLSDFRRRWELEDAHPRASRRTINALMRAGLSEFDVSGLTDYGLLQIPGIGPVSLRELRG